MSTLPSQPELLEMRGITKRYGATSALNGVSLTVRAGEIHALLGENGAGKSTLMHILSGLTMPNAGDILLDGQAVRFSTPRDARHGGIAMVHQHFTLVPAFTVEENLALDAVSDGKQKGYCAKRAAEPALKRARALGWNLNPSARIDTLPVGTQQRVEIIRALATDARLLIFDEPTAVLAADEVDELFGVLRRLRSEGKSIILIAHKLAEIMAVADRVTVLRRGSNVATTIVANTNPSQLAAWMIGNAPEPYTLEGKEQNSLPLLPTPNTRTPEHLNTEHPNTGMTASDIQARGDRGELALRGLALQVQFGEILGIGGVDGNGQTELAEVLVGLRRPESGFLHWRGQNFQAGTNPRIGYIPQDRRRAGLAVTLSVETNLLFGAVQDRAYRRGPFLRRRRLARLAADLLRKYDIRAANGQVPVSTLSGGNQQKIVVARALHAQPEWIVAVNPTRGLDIGATRFVHSQLRQARQKGAAIVVISTDLDELAVLSDRQMILSGGLLSDYAADACSATQLGLLLGGVTAAQPPSPIVEVEPPS